MAVQLFVLIPIYFAKSKGTEKRGASVGKWIAASIAAFVVPLLFAKL